MVCNIVTPGEKNLIWKCSTSCGEMVGNITKLWLHSRISCLYQSHKTAVTKYATLLFLISYGEKKFHTELIEGISVLFFTIKKRSRRAKRQVFTSFLLVSDLYREAGLVMNFCVTSNDHKETLEITYYFWKTLVFFPSFFVKSECASHIPIKSDTPSYDSIEMTNILRKFWQFFSASLLNYRLLSWASFPVKNQVLLFTM